MAEALSQAIVDECVGNAHGNLTTVIELVDQHPEVVNARGIHDLPSLYFAAIGGGLEVAELLLAAGTDVNEQAEAAAPIHGAVMGGQAAMVRLLLSHGADPERPDFKGRGARQLAEDMERPDLAALFG